jgi:malonyl CoA-acyl carrier protein transacylase
VSKESVLVVCPGRGTYNAPELGYLARYHAGSDWLRRFDEMRGDKATLSELDGAVRFDPGVHLRGDVAAPLIYAASYLDFLSLDRERFEVVAVTGNAMGWYTALACAGAVSGEHGFAIADAMGGNSQLHEPGGQAVLVLAGADWRVDPAVRAGVAAAMARHGVLASIMLGGMLVVAGTDAALDALTVDVSGVLPRAPLRLAGHGPFHTPLMGPSSAAARAGLPVEWFGGPQVPLIDGRGKVWRRFDSTAEALWDYTFGAQILTPYDFSAAMTVALREFAPDRIVLLGPGETLGGAIGQVMVALDWLDIGDKAGFAARQGSDAFLIGMGRPSQRGIAAQRGCVTS